MKTRGEVERNSSFSDQSELDFMEIVSMKTKVMSRRKSRQQKEVSHLTSNIQYGEKYSSRKITVHGTKENPVRQKSAQTRRNYKHSLEQIIDKANEYGGDSRTKTAKSNSNIRSRKQFKTIR